MTFNLSLPVPLLMFSGIAALVIAIIVLAIVSEKKRREAFQAFAAMNGFTFEAKVPGPSALGLPQIELFQRGHSRRVGNALSGELEGSAVRVFDYSYTVGSGKNSSTHTQTLIAVSISNTGLPSFTLAQENFFHKIGQAFGYQDIDFDMFPEFSKHYLLRGENETAIRTLFDKRVIDAYTNGLNCNVEVRDGWIFSFTAGKRLKVEDIQSRIEATFSFLFELRGE